MTVLAPPPRLVVGLIEHFTISISKARAMVCQCLSVTSSYCRYRGSCPRCPQNAASAPTRLPVEYRSFSCHHSKQFSTLLSEEFVHEFRARVMGLHLFPGINIIHIEVQHNTFPARAASPFLLCHPRDATTWTWLAGSFKHSNFLFI
jgi:hypothetical protein